MVAAIFEQHFEASDDRRDYVQLKDVAALLAEFEPACHTRLCHKPRTLVPSHEALAAATGRVLRIEVRTGSVTLPGGVQARGVLRGYRRTTTRPVRAHARPPP